MTGIGIRRREDETWLEAALRLARPYQLEKEVREDYERFVSRGVSDEEAAWAAAYEWDIAEIIEDDE